LLLYQVTLFSVIIHFSIRGCGGTVFKFPENLCDEIRLEFQSRKFLWKSNLNEINIFEAAKKTIKIWFTIQWTFQPSLVPIGLVVSEKIIKMWKVYRQRQNTGTREHDNHHPFSKTTKKWKKNCIVSFSYITISLIIW
jgi:hypothetical protein